MPVNHIDYWRAARFANWLHNDQPAGAQDATTTEDGAYTFVPGGNANDAAARNAGASVFMPTDQEWYKAAYYDTTAKIYYEYPTESYTPTTCSPPTTASNTANCANAVGDLTVVGSSPNSASPNGTFDQGGNLWEWNESGFPSATRRLRAGSSGLDAINLSATGFYSLDASEVEYVTERFISSVGFRVAWAIPAPTVKGLTPIGLSMLGSLLGLAICTGGSLPFTLPKSGSFGVFEREAADGSNRRLVHGSASGRSEPRPQYGEVLTKATHLVVPGIFIPSFLIPQMIRPVARDEKEGARELLHVDRDVGAEQAFFLQAADETAEYVEVLRDLGIETQGLVIAGELQIVPKQEVVVAVMLHGDEHGRDIIIRDGPAIWTTRANSADCGQQFIPQGID